MQRIIQMTNLYYKLERIKKEPVVAYVSMWLEGLRNITKKLWIYVTKF